jgi:hypothetical protein
MQNCLHQRSELSDADWFSYVGLLDRVMLMQPNILWTKISRRSARNYVGNENKVLLALERSGEMTLSE